VNLVDLACYVAIGLNVWGNFALARKAAYGWWVRIACNLIWGVYGVALVSWPNIINSIIFFGINVYGIIVWRRKPTKPKPLRGAGCRSRRRRGYR
jgi:hypothetical protein